MKRKPHGSGWKRKWNGHDQRGNGDLDITRVTHVIKTSQRLIDHAHVTLLPQHLICLLLEVKTDLAFRINAGAYLAIRIIPTCHFYALGFRPYKMINCFKHISSWANLKKGHGLIHVGVWDLNTIRCSDSICRYWLSNFVQPV